MAVSGTTTSHSYKPGSAMAAESLAGIEFSDQSELTVTHFNAVTLAETVLSEGVHYTIGGTGLTGNGTITAIGSWPADDEFRIARATPRTQEVEFNPFELPDPDAIRAGLDKLTRIAQELGDKAARAQAVADAAAELNQRLVGLPHYYSTYLAAIGETVEDDLFTCDQDTDLAIFRRTASAPYYELVSFIYQAKEVRPEYFANWDADNTTNACLAALATGRDVILTHGVTYKVSANIGPVANYQRLGGSGVLDFIGNCGLVIPEGLVGCDIDVNINAPLHTGTAIKVLGAERSEIKTYIADAFNAVYIESANTTELRGWATCRGDGVQWFGNDTKRSDILTTWFVVDPGAGKYGFIWDGNCHSHDGFMGVVGGKGIVIRNTEGVATFPAIGRALLQVDYSETHGIAIEAGLDYDLICSYALGAAGSGLWIGPAINSYQVRLTGGKFVGNARYGIENLGGPVLEAGNTDKSSNTLGEVLGNVWSRFTRVNLDDNFYLARDGGGNPILVYDANDYEAYDRALNTWRRFIGGVEVSRTDSGGLFPGLIKTQRALAGAVARSLTEAERDRDTLFKFGVKGDARKLAGGAITSGTATLTVAGAGFTAADVGKYIEVAGAGAAGALLCTTIAAWISATQVTLAANAGTTVAAAAVLFATNDTAAINLALAQGRTIYAPGLDPDAGSVPQLPYICDYIELDNGGGLIGEYGQTLFKQRGGANQDFVRLASVNVSNWRLAGLMLDGNGGVNTTGCGINIVGPTASVGAYNPQVSVDPYFSMADLLVFNTAGDGLRMAGAAADGTAMRAGGSTIKNVRTFNCRNRGAYIDLYDGVICDLDCGVTGKQGIVFDQQCGALFVRGVKGWYTGQITPAQGEGVIVGGGQSTFKQVFAQANIPGHGIKLVGFYESDIDFVVQGAGNVTGFGATPAYLYVGTGSTLFKARGVCSQTAGAPFSTVNLIEFSTGTHASYDIDITHQGTYASLLAGDTQFPVGGGGVIQSIVLNGSQQLGRALRPVYPAGQNPTAGWVEYCDANMGNALVLRSSGGLTIPITPLEYTIAALPAAAAALKGARAYVTNGVAAPVLGAVPSTTGTTYCPVYCDGAAWRYG